VNGAESVRFDVSVISCVAESVRNDVSLTESTRYDVSLTESVGCDRVRQELRELEQVRLLRCANVTESVSPSVRKVTESPATMRERDLVRRKCDLVSDRSDVGLTSCPSGTTWAWPRVRQV
jgi:hypothetical protein